MSKYAYGAFEVDVIKRTRSGVYWDVPDDLYEVLPEWTKRSSLPFDISVAQQKLADYQLISVSAVSEALPADLLVPATVQDLSQLVGEEVASFVQNNLPAVLLWQYKEANLLPSSISIEAFAANPEICVPLKNMFLLAGIANVAESIAEAQKGTRNALINLLSRVAQKTTEHFRSVWKEYEGIQFELRPDGEDIIPGVRERNLFDFSRRSDGFKRFVSFLLLVSVIVRSGTLVNTILLVDEPDISLHPSGARYLRDELLRISESNVVLYSTHSIFMVDRERVDRHLIVTKTTEETRLEVANDDNLFAEEVLYNALGYSVFELLKQKNIIFEGWRDKHLFLTALKRVPASHSLLKAAFKEIGACHARGVKHIKSITPLIELANRNCLIISDGDAPAREHQAAYVSERGYGIWKRYDELISTSVDHVTGEDFIKPAAFLPLAKEIASRTPALAPLKEDDLRQHHSKLRTIDRWLAAAAVTPEHRKAEITKLKDALFDALKPTDIEPAYYDLLAEMNKMLT
ncbi:ATP-dependent nuclease [Bradyrhizobium sp. BWC-3-1]|uniref:ATP-dependent nuclease n=1 Tax=Bradyrhizobium sp. BWC-3-1 TaxID=3080012 RepID=UPI00293E417F|nr:AAA family ATPase [Bradyrhizobium sp. BWC-3-1]WOH57405.1 AAA family ATPase [Bradyrhizobium sp. BWC-3-1]